MVLLDTPPSTPLNFSEMIGDDLDLDDLEEISFDDLDQQMSDDLDEDDVSDGSIGEELSEVKQDDAALTFKGHRGPVFCCHMDPHDGVLAVTGGGDERMLVWNTENGDVIFEETGFKDSVISAEFSHDGKYVAGGCMGGVLKVWRLNPTGAPQRVLNENVEEVMWLKWHHKAHILLSGVMHGIMMWKIPSGECKVIHNAAALCDVGHFMPDGKRAVAGFKDGIIKVFDLSSGATSFTIKNPELDSILCLASHPDNNLVAAGTLNTKMVLFSSQTGKVLSLITCLEQRENEEMKESVESVTFSKELSLPLLAIGTLSTVILYDYSKQVVRFKYLINEGITKLLWNFPGPLIFIGTQSGEVKLLDARSGPLESVLHGHRANVMDMAFLRDAKKLLTSSDDATVKVFSVDY